MESRKSVQLLHKSAVVHLDLSAEMSPCGGGGVLEKPRASQNDLQFSATCQEVATRNMLVRALPQQGTYL